MTAARKSTGRDDEFDIDSAIHNMPDTYIQCRDFNHSWRPFTANWSQKERCYEVQLKCSRCKTTRHRLMNAEGSLLANRYTYADGYLIKGMGRMIGDERDKLRLESVLRILPSKS